MLGCVGLQRGLGAVRFGVHASGRFIRRGGRVGGTGLTARGRRLRETWGEAALELHRDRARDERGFIGRIGLWLDLLADAAVSIPREYRRASPALATVAMRPRSDALPSFQMLERGSPRAGALPLGGVVSLAIAIVFSISG